MIPTGLRVTVGKAVRDWISMIQGELNSEVNPYSDEVKNLFWLEFAAEIKRRDLLQAESEPNKEFTDEQGEAFGRQFCPFNQYKGIANRAVPYEYLAWIVDANKTLEKYVHWRAKKRF